MTQTKEAYFLTLMYECHAAKRNICAPTGVWTNNHLEVGYNS